MEQVLQQLKEDLREYKRRKDVKLLPQKKEQVKPPSVRKGEEREHDRVV